MFLSSFLAESILICSINPTVWKQSPISSAIFSPLHTISEIQHRVPPQLYVASFLSSYPALAYSSGLSCQCWTILQFSSVTKSCLTLCYPADCNTPGLPVHHQLPEFTHTHVHWVGDANSTISSSVVPFSSCLQSLPESGSFLISQLFTSGGQRFGASALASALPMNIQDWFPLGLTTVISLQSKGLSKVFSNTTLQKYQFFSTQPSVWSNSHSTWLLEKS